MTFTRRKVLLRGAATAAALTSKGIGGQPRNGLPVERSVPYITDSYQKSLIQKAINAAMDAGASYADARLTYTRNWNPIVRQESMEFGVLALADGYWGFAASPVWNLIEAARLGSEATAHAKANVFGAARDIELAPSNNDPGGHWIMPVKDDPFKMPVEEIYDTVRAVRAFISRLKGVVRPSAGIDFVYQEKAFGNSLNHFNTQVLYRALGSLSFELEKGHINEPGYRKEIFALDRLTYSGQGFEYFRDQPLREYILEEYETALKDIELPVIPVDVGKFPVLINQYGTARLISKSIGLATQIDRAMGYEANAGGTSYISDPATMLGSFKIGNSMVNINADRSKVGSVGRVCWDDEGVKPVKFPLVKEGILVNMQTSREGAGWIKEHYESTGQPYQSFGCKYTPSAIDAPLIHSADLTLEPDRDSALATDDLRSQIDDGIELYSPEITMDFQQITGFIDASRIKSKAYQIKNGKRTAKLQGAGALFRTPELWGNVAAIGGANSLRMFGLDTSKGEPSQTSFHSVEAPSVLFNDVSVIDITRKA